MAEVINASHTRRRFLRLAAAATASALPRTLRAEQQDATATAFEEVWQTVRDRFYDPHMHGLDWAAIREGYAPAAARATSQDALANVINSMLSELHASHTRYYTPDEPEYYPNFRSFL